MRKRIFTLLAITVMAAAMLVACGGGGGGGADPQSSGAATVPNAWNSAVWDQSVWQ